MMELLVDQWGLKENLAVALISHYGGNIYDTHLAVDRLNEQRSLFRSLDAYASQNVLRCIRYKETYPSIIDVLNSLCEKGFAQLADIDDAVVQILNENSVAGVVTSSSSFITGVTDTDFGVYDFGIVPLHQSIRLVIAKCLAECGE